MSYGLAAVGFLLFMLVIRAGQKGGSAASGKLGKGGGGGGGKVALLLGLLQGLCAIGFSCCLIATPYIGPFLVKATTTVARVLARWLGGAGPVLLAIIGIAMFLALLVSALQKKVTKGALMVLLTAPFILIGASGSVGDGGRNVVGVVQDGSMDGFGSVTDGEVPR